MVSTEKDFVSMEELQTQQYAESMTTAEHIGVVLNRARTGEGGDWDVSTSARTTVVNIGRILAKDSLSYADAIDLVDARAALKDLEAVNEHVSKRKPEDETMYGYLVGVSQLMQVIFKAKSE